MNVQQELTKLKYKIIKTSKSVGNGIVVVEQTTDRVSEIDTLAKLLGGTVDRSKAGGRTGRIKVAGKFIYIKPGDDSKGAKETLGIQSNTLVRGGKSEDCMWADKTFRAKTFTNTAALEQSVVHGLKQNKNVSKEIVDFVDDLLSKKKFNNFTWPIDIREHEKNQLGKYLGELVLGYLALDGRTQFFHPNPFNKRVGRFIMPDDPTFSSVDSIVELDDGSIVPISSKFGQGAKASFFSGILQKGVDHADGLKQSEFKKIVDTTVGMGIRKITGNAMKIIYEYGIREILQLSKVQIHDTHHVYQQLLVNNFLDNQVATVVGTVRELETNPRMLATLPRSVGAYFTGVMADRLNKDDVAMEQMKRILAGKDFWQANLNIPAWMKGRVEYRLVRTTNISLAISRGKAALDDVGMKQGSLNYVLRAS